MSDRKVFLESSPRTSSYKELLTTYFFMRLTLKEKIETLKEVLITAVNGHNDKAALNLLKFIKSLYHRKEKTDLTAPRFKDWLMDELWWKLPDKRIANTGQHPDDDEIHPTMTETKKWILRQIAEDWRPRGTKEMHQQVNVVSSEAFEFLNATYGPMGKMHPFLTESGDKFRERSERRQVFPEEKKTIIDLFMARDKFFSPEELSWWIKLPFIHYDIERTLAIARTRGKPNIWKGDIRNAELIDPLDPDNKHSVSFQLAKFILKALAERKKEIDQGIEDKDKGVHLTMKSLWIETNFGKVLVNIKIDIGSFV